MLRFYLRLTLIPIALFTVVLILIHAQPYDDHELRELLLPEGCPALCFMGIRPGVTTKDEALRLLESNKWVGEIYRQSLNYGGLMWSASPSAPSNVDRNQINTVLFFKDKVLAVVFWANFRLSDLRMLFGSPDREDLAINNIGQFYYRVEYYDDEVIVTVARPCLQHEITIWDANIGEIYLRSLAKRAYRDNRPPWGERVSCVLLQSLKPAADN